MVRFIYSPEWFYGIDSLFELFFIVVTLLISYYAFKLFKFSKNNNYKWFSLSFLLFSLAFLFKIFTNITVYSKFFERTTTGMINLLFFSINQYELFYIIGYLGFRFFILLGLIGIYMVLYKNTSLNDMVIYSWLFFLVCILSHYQFVFFHLTAFLLIMLIVIYYMGYYIDKKNDSSLFTLIAFIFLLFGQVFFIFTLINNFYYVLGEIMQLFGFLILLLIYIWVTRK